MPKRFVPIGEKHYRAIQRRIRRLGKGTVPSEVNKALNLYLAGPRGIEAAFEQLLKKKMPKDFSAMLARFNENMKAIRRTMKELGQERKKTDKLRKASLMQQIKKSRAFYRLGRKGLTFEDVFGEPIVLPKKRASSNREYAKQMALAKKGMATYRNTLRTLAK